jgi:cytochrome P450
MNLEDMPLLSKKGRFGHFVELRDDRLAFFHRFNRECGDIGRASIFGFPVVFANGPEVLHEVLVDKARFFIKSAGLRGPLKPLAGDGLFTAEGDLWRQQRKLMAPLFTHARIERYAGAMAECSRDAVAKLKVGDVVDVARLSTHVAMRIAGKTLFDTDTLDEADELGAALTDALHWVNDRSISAAYAAQLRAVGKLAEVVERLPSPMRERGELWIEALIEPARLPGKETKKIEAALDTIERLVHRMIADRRASGTSRPDLLSMLLEAHDEGGTRMSDKQVRDEIVTLFIAGHETTATALAWSLYLLARDPAAYARAVAEARGLPGPSIGVADLPALGYCLRVFKEAMRLYPPIYFFGRQTIADVRIGKYDLLKGTVVLISSYALHHRPELYPDPERFDPSRFEHAAEEARHRQAYIPFSAGPRTCIGNHFALMEGPIVLATILRRLDLELTSPAVIEPDPSATLRPKGGVPMRVTAVDPPYTRAQGDEACS